MEEKKIEEKEEIKNPPLQMIIEMTEEGMFKVSFPALQNKWLTYGFLKMAEKTLDTHYASQQKIIKPQGNIMDFVRKIKH